MVEHFSAEKSEIEYEKRKRDRGAIMNSLCDRCVGGWCLLFVILMTIVNASNAHVLRIFQSEPPPARYQFNKKALQPAPGKGKSVWSI